MPLSPIIICASIGRPTGLCCIQRRLGGNWRAIQGNGIFSPLPQVKAQPPHRATHVRTTEIAGANLSSHVRLLGPDIGVRILPALPWPITRPPGPNLSPWTSLPGPKTLLPASVTPSCHPRPALVYPGRHKLTSFRQYGAWIWPPGAGTDLHANPAHSQVGTYVLYGTFTTLGSQCMGLCRFSEHCVLHSKSTLSLMDLMRFTNFTLIQDIIHNIKYATFTLKEENYGCSKISTWNLKKKLLIIYLQIIPIYKVEGLQGGA